MSKAMFVVAAAMICFGMTASATERWHNSTLAWVYPQAAGDFVMGFDVSPTFCTNANTPVKYLYVTVGQNGVTAEGAQKMYAAALTALSLAKPLTVAFDDSTSSCYVNRLLLVK